MCMVDLADLTDVCSSLEHTARKHYQCSECNMVIYPGERYERTFTVVEGRSNQIFTCRQCFAARDWLIRECSGYCFGLIYEDLVDHWHDDRICTMELARLIVGMRRRIKVSRWMRGMDANPE